MRACDHLSESDRYLSVHDATAQHRARTFASDHGSSPEVIIRGEVPIHIDAFTLRGPLTIAALAVSCWPFSAVQLGAQAPGDDFFAYANGAWLKATALPKGRDRWAVRDEINERTRKQLAALLRDSGAPGSLARKVFDFRAALLNESAIEQKGLTPLAPTLSQIDQIGDRTALARFLGSTMHLDVDPLGFGDYTSASVLGLAIQHSIHGEGEYSAFLVQGGLGLGERDRYLSTEAADVAARGRYRAYIARLLSAAGLDRANERADSVLALETAIAEAHATFKVSAVDRNADNIWEREHITHLAPGMDWDAFLDAAGLGTSKTVVAWQPSAVKGISSLVATRSLDAWKDYLRFHALDDRADVLPRAFAAAAAEMRGDARSREERAMALTEAEMSHAVGELYAKRYFSVAQKARVRGIVKNVCAAFRERVAHLTWLSPESRAIALTKLDGLYVGIGYPESWEDWGDLRIDSTDAFGNLERVVERGRRQALAKLGKPYDTLEWVMAPHTAGAVLIFQQNAYTFAAALLQSPKYDSTMSDAAAYGAIGAIIGHDMAHFIDVLGADYEPNGRMRRWWTAEDSTKFEAVAEPLVQQFAAYEPIPGVRVDGRLTRTENVADLAGLTAAFDAHRKALGAKVASKADVRRADREFFIAFARAFGVKMNEAAMRAQLATDHAPEMLRFNAVRNIDAWYDAFDVAPGQRLYLEPSARVRIW